MADEPTLVAAGTPGEGGTPAGAGTTQEGGTAQEAGPQLTPEQVAALVAENQRLTAAREQDLGRIGALEAQQRQAIPPSTSDPLERVIADLYQQAKDPTLSIEDRLSANADLQVALAHYQQRQVPMIVRPIVSELEQWQGIPHEDQNAVRGKVKQAGERGEKISARTAHEMVKQEREIAELKKKAEQPRSRESSPVSTTSGPAVTVSQSGKTIKLSEYNALYDTDQKAFGEAMKKKDRGELKIVPG